MSIDELISMRIGEICSVDGVKQEEACEQLAKDEPWMRDAVEEWEGN